MRLASVLLLVASAAFAVEPIPKSDAKRSIFPALTVPADPSPALPKPGVIPVLAGDVQLVVASDEPFLLFDSPRGLVSVTRETGPLKIRGKFLDGSGKTETRTYSQKNIAIVTASEGKGRVELIAVPAGLMDENKAERLIIDVNGAQPPPKPDPIDPPVPVTSFRVLFVYESGNTLTQAQTAVMYAKSVSDYLTANTTKEGEYAGWRRWDQDVNTATETPTMKALWAAVKPKLTAVPCIVIERNGKADILPFPANPAEAVALFRKYKEGQ